MGVGATLTFLPTSLLGSCRVDLGMIPGRRHKLVRPRIYLACRLVLFLLYLLQHLQIRGTIYDSDLQRRLPSQVLK